MCVLLMFLGRCEISCLFRRVVGQVTVLCFRTQLGIVLSRFLPLALDATESSQVSASGLWLCSSLCFSLGPVLEDACD